MSDPQVLNPQMYEGIKALLTSLFPGIYEAKNMFKGFENDYTLPANSKYIVITEFDSEPQGITPAWHYADDVGITTYYDLNASEFEVDFYGEPAETSCKLLQVVLRSAYATNFLNDYDCNIYKVNKVLNLTHILDRENYLPRFLIRFGVFNNNYFTYSDPGFTSLTPELYFAEAQT